MKGHQWKNIRNKVIEHGKKAFYMQAFI
jgi:hypothetical protein